MIINRDDEESHWQVEEEELEMAARFIGALLMLLTLLTSELRGSLAVWTAATATFYGGSDASGTMGGCPILLRNSHDVSSQSCIATNSKISI